MTTLFDKTIERPRYTITPRQYQHEALEESIRLWESGVIGVLMRIFTGGGKTIATCMLADHWLQQDENNRVMILSYEKQLVWQFAQEIEDVLGITSGIEMEAEFIEPDKIPRVVVASRQTLQQHKLVTPQQNDLLWKAGLTEDDIGLCTMLQAKSILRLIDKEDFDVGVVRDQLSDWKQDYRCNLEAGQVSRLFKFNKDDNWLVCFDEAHKHAYKLETVGHIVDWFGHNPNHRRLGMTATPKRADGISIGHTMFPGVAIDYPLCIAEGPCAVRDGYAVPYIQKYIEVEGVDFDEIKKLCGTNQKKWDQEMAIRLEETLAGLCDPLLDLVGDRRTLVFSPSVQTAKDVSDYINARVKCKCPSCEKVQWESASRLGDGIDCRQCETRIELHDTVRLAFEQDKQCEVVWGEVHPADRRKTYEGHQSGKFQFLSVCGLCREGYNDPDIACVAIFRPVSRAASSLAEQMKGRGSRPLRGLIEGMDTAEDRLEAIEGSAKPNCLVIDLTGVTGLGDCATTVQIYAEGEPDEVVERAESLVSSGVEDVQDAIKRAKKEIEEEKEEIRKEREERNRLAVEHAKARATAGARARYTEHEIGYGSRDVSIASPKSMKYIRFLGMEVAGVELSQRQASRIIDQLKEGTELDKVAYKNGLSNDNWQASEVSSKQKWFLRSKGITVPEGCTPSQASSMINRIKKGLPAQGPPVSGMIDMIADCNDTASLDRIGRNVAKQRDQFRTDEWMRIVAAGKIRRSALNEDF